MSDIHGKLIAAREQHRHVLSDIAEALADAEQRHAEQCAAIERQIADMAIRLDAAQRAEQASAQRRQYAYTQWDADRVMAERWRGVLPLLRALTAYVAEDGTSFTPVREAIAAACEAGYLDGISEEPERDVPSLISFFGAHDEPLPYHIRASIDIPEGQS